MHIEKAAYAFRLNGQPISCLCFGHGHINQTLKITTDTDRDYILQIMYCSLFLLFFIQTTRGQILQEYRKIKKVEPPSPCGVRVGWDQVSGAVV